MAEFFCQSRESAAERIESLKDKVREAETLLSSLQFVKDSNPIGGPSDEWDLQVEIIDKHVDRLQSFLRAASDLDMAFKKVSEAGESLLNK